MKLVRSDYAKNKIQWAVSAVFQAQLQAPLDSERSRREFQEAVNRAIADAIEELPTDPAPRDPN